MSFREKGLLWNAEQVVWVLEMSGSMCCVLGFMSSEMLFLFVLHSFLA